MKTLILAMGFTVAAMGAAQANCERSIKNETATGYELVVYHSQGDEFVEFRRTSVPANDTASFKMDSDGAPMQLRFLAAGESDAETFIVLFNLFEDDIANCSFGSGGSEGFCANYPEAGYMTIMDPFRNCGLSG